MNTEIVATFLYAIIFFVRETKRVYIAVRTKWIGEARIMYTSHKYGENKVQNRMKFRILWNITDWH